MKEENPVYPHNRNDYRGYVGPKHIINETIDLINKRIDSDYVDGYLLVINLTPLNWDVNSGEGIAEYIADIYRGAGWNVVIHYGVFGIKMMFNDITVRIKPPWK